MASRNKANLDNLLQGYQRTDPRLYEILKAVIGNLNSLIDDVTPIIVASESGEITVGTLADVTLFEYQLLLYSVRFTWAKPSEDVQFFEIRKGSGTWESADYVLASKTLVANIDPLTVGSHTYQIRATNEAGNYSTNSLFLVVVVPAIGSISISSQVIDNNVLLSWTPATSSFQLKEYIITKDGVEIGRQPGTFTVIFERSAGEFEYGVQALDIAGNLSDVSLISVTVSAPKDYVLRDQEVDAAFDGTRVNVFKSVIPDLYMPVDLTETWTTHFSARSWSTIQAQINAGYPIYAQPTLNTATYTKVFDYGAIFSNVLATINYSLEQIVSTVSVSVQLRTSDDNVSWSSPVTASSIFATSMRYLECQLTFTASV